MRSSDRTDHGPSGDPTTNEIGREHRDWDPEYRRLGAVWGDEPSVLARYALHYFRGHRLRTERPRLLDVGCGYGRDAVALAEYTEIRGIDASATAIEAARRRTKELGIGSAEFLCGDFWTAPWGTADIVYCSNIYHLLRPGERQEFVRRIGEALAAGGLLLLSTLSSRDPQHAATGIPVDGDVGSIVDPDQQKYLHLSTESELRQEFAGFEMLLLEEHDYIEPRKDGDHHHVSWILVARKKRSQRE